MGLYSFRPQFTAHIRSGRKKHTIRAKRKDGWVEKPGNTMYLYENVRTKNGKHIDDRECARVEEIRIEMQVYVGKSVLLRGCQFPHVIVAGNDLSATEKEALAFADGFDSFADMMKFWKGKLPFEGYIIHWR